MDIIHDYLKFASMFFKSLSLFLCPVIFTIIFCQLCGFENEIAMTFCGNVILLCLNIGLLIGYQSDVRQERVCYLFGLVLLMPTFLFTVVYNPNIQKSLKNIIVGVAGLFGMYVGFGLAGKKNVSDVEMLVGVVLSLVSGIFFSFFAFDGYIIKKIKCITDKIVTKLN